MRSNSSRPTIPGLYNLTGGLDPERLPTLTVSSGFFDALGTPPAIGRGFIRQEEAWGSHRVAIVTYGLWQRRFGGDRNLVGQSITLNGQPFNVIGILPREFSFLGFDAQLFVPMAFEPGDHMNSHSNHFLRMFGRLRPDVSREQANDDLACDLEVHRGGAIHQQRYGVEPDTAARPARWKRCPNGAVRPAGGGRVRAADLLRKPRQSVIGARRGPAAGSRGTPGARRLARKAAPAIPRGESDPVAGRWGFSVSPPPTRPPTRSI